MFLNFAESKFFCVCMCVCVCVCVCVRVTVAILAQAFRASVWWVGE